MGCVAIDRAIRQGHFTRLDILSFSSNERINELRMSANVRIALLLLFVSCLSFALLPIEAKAAGSIAFGQGEEQEQWASGWSVDARTKSDADATALNNCQQHARHNENCKILGRFWKKCGALAVENVANSAAFAFGDTKEEASQQAHDKCVGIHGIYCTVRDVVCDVAGLLVAAPTYSAPQVQNNNSGSPPNAPYVTPDMNHRSSGEDGF